MATGTRATKRFVFTFIRKAHMSNGTMGDIMHVFVYRLNACRVGLVAFDDMFGHAIPEGSRRFLARGWRGALTEIRGGELFR